MSNRIITTAEDLDGLPVYSVVLDGDGIAYQHYGTWEPGSDETQWSADGGWWHAADIALPATVLHEPEATA